MPQPPTHPDIWFPLIIGTATALIFIVFIVLFIANYQRKQRAFRKEREAFDQALLKTKVEIQEYTLNNISRELHDNVGQIAALIKVQLELMPENIPNDGQEKMNEIKELAQNLMDEIRTISTGLKSQNINRFGLLEMIKTDIVRYKKIGSLDIVSNISNDLKSLSDETSIFIYRMFQEMFSNTIKHARANKVLITISKKDDDLLFSFSDNGIGFDASGSGQHGSGLINLRERSKFINANLRIDSQIKKGTTISFNVKA